MYKGCWFSKDVNIFLIVLLWLCFGPLAHASSAEAAENMTPVDPLTRVFRNSVIVDQPNAIIELWAARNEYESIQLAVYSEIGSNIVRVEATDLVDNQGHSIPKEVLSVRYPDDVFLRNHTQKTPLDELEGEVPGLYPDPLELIPEANFQGARSIWLSWFVASQTMPGDYQGQVTVETTTGERVIPVTLHVWSFALPATPTMFQTNWIHISQIEKNYGVVRGDPDFWTAIESMAEDFVVHRNGMVYSPLGLIRSTELSNGTYSFDFSDYIKWVNIFKTRGLVSYEGSHLTSSKSYNLWSEETGLQIPFGKEQLNKPEGQKFVEELLEALQVINTTLGIQNDYVQHVSDEADVSLHPLYNEIAAIVHAAMPGVPTFDATQYDEAGRPDLMDIPVPLMGKELATSNISFVEKWGNWWYTAVEPRNDIPNRFIDYPLLKLRVIPWLTWSHGRSGYLHYGVNWWHTTSFRNPDSVREDVEQGGTYPPGDGFIVYPPKLPSSLEVVSSLRWEAMREGMEDVEYLYALDAWIAAGSSNLSCGALISEASVLKSKVQAEFSSVKDYPRQNNVVNNLRMEMGVLLDNLNKCALQGSVPVASPPGSPVLSVE